MAYPRAENTGLLCGSLVAIDIDILDEEHALAVRALALDLLGSTSLERIGRAPKRALLYGCLTPFKKMQTAEYLFGDAITNARVEVLAEGQQIVALGDHPSTRTPYTWPNQSPITVPFSELPLVDYRQCREFLERAGEYLEQAGGETPQKRKKQQKAGLRSAGLTKDAYPEPELVREVLDYVPNDDLPYDEWIKIGYALYDALGAAGYEVWASWSASSSKNTPETTASKWPSFANAHSITRATLFYLARQRGWRRSRDPSGVTRAPVGGSPNRSDRRDLPTIRLSSNEIPQNVSDAERALKDGGSDYYQRGSELVRIVRVPVSKSNGQTRGATRIARATRDDVVETLTRVANFEKYDSDADAWIPTGCPTRIADIVLNRLGPRNLELLTGVSNTPILRQDGSILETPGYDEVTGIYLEPEDHFPRINALPTEEDARAALRFVKDLLSTFPFASGVDLSVALSAIVTAVVRLSLTSAPMHVITAPTAGSGKSLLADVASTIATGSPVAVMTQGKSAEEFEKRIAAALIDGRGIISIDNCETYLSGDLLCQVLTQPLVDVRILGQSKMMSVPTKVSVFATGNNLRLEGDVVRRALVCQLDAQLERPELRKFTSNPLELIAGARGQYVAAVLTIVKAYIVAGRPSRLTALGSFESWSRMVREPLTWLGEADPCLSMERNRHEDPQLEVLTIVMEFWKDAFAGDRIETWQLIDLCNARRALKDAVLTVADTRGEVSAVRLGKWLSKVSGRVVRGQRIVADGDGGGVKKWRLEVIAH